VMTARSRKGLRDASQPNRIMHSAVAIHDVGIGTPASGLYTTWCGGRVAYAR
jgi:hypothetical protein